MCEYRYICILSGVAELTPEFSDSVFQAVDAEIELNLRDGICYLECARAANSLEEAILATIAELERADIGIRVVRVDTEDSGVVDRINSQLMNAVQTCYARS